MRRSLLALLLLGAGLWAGTPARAELDEIGLLNAEIQASACARYHQLFAAYDLEFLVPDLRTTVLGRIRAQRPSEAQFGHLERLYDATRVQSADSGLKAGSRKAELSRGLLEVLQVEAEGVLGFCDRWVFHPSQVQPAPEEPGLEKHQMENLASLASMCGYASLLTTRYEFDELYPEYREILLDNVRRLGANEGQIQELDRYFDEGVLEAERSGRDWDREISSLQDEYTRNWTIEMLAEKYQMCATEDFNLD